VGGERAGGRGTTRTTRFSIVESHDKSCHRGRPETGKDSTRAQAGSSGGEYPYWIEIKGTNATFSSQRDPRGLWFWISRLAACAWAYRSGSAAQQDAACPRRNSALTLRMGGADTVSVVDTRRDRVVERFQVTAPHCPSPRIRAVSKARTNSLALSPDGQILYVTNEASKRRRDRAARPARSTAGADLGREDTTDISNGRARWRG